MPEAPLLRFELPDGRKATLLLGEASTVLSIGDAVVSSWDLAGRPYALVSGTGTYRRGLDGRLLWKREATAQGPRLRRRLSAVEGEPIVEAARADAALALAALAGLVPSHTAVGDIAARGPDRAPDVPLAQVGSGAMPPARSQAARECVRRLQAIVALDAAALRDDAARFLAASGPVGILPPDQYLSLVVRVTEGCSWNACAFCSLYRDVPFRWKRLDELDAHLAALVAYFGPSLALRRSVFLGDANALCLAHDRLLPLVERVAARFPGIPLHSFLDAWTGQRRSPAEWRDYAGLGLKRVYLGLETGDPGLLAWLEKPGAPQDAVDLVAALHEADIAAGVIVLLGAGGERFADAHSARTAEVLTRMRLGADDLVYFSELVEEAGLEYGRRARSEPDLAPLDPAGCASQRAAILSGFRPQDPGRPPRVATYDIREFVY